MELSNKGRNLIIYDFIQSSDLEIFKKKYKLKDWLESYNPVYNIYYGKTYNPPFFNNIISIKKNNMEDVEKIWNMTIYNGTILISNFFKRKFSNSIVFANEKYILIRKNMQTVYRFKEYHVIDFIIAGTMKGGTTAGMVNFNKHSEISMPENEIHYYDIKSNYQKGLEWYKSHFDYSKKIIGDKAPDVMYMTSCLELLQMVNPQVKIILFLRNPIERAYSHWKMLRDHFGNKNSFEYIINDELKNRIGEPTTYNISFWSHLIQRGFYFSQIMEIEKYFHRDNIMILISEKIRGDMNNEYQKIFKFIGVSDFNCNFEEVFGSLSKDTIDKNGKLYKKLKKIFNSDVKKLEKYLGYKTEWW